jgi:hypothetical protein
MRATVIVRHEYVALKGAAANGLVARLTQYFGHRIENHAAAVAESRIYGGNIAAEQFVVYAFRPTLTSIGICSRTTPLQTEISLETALSDICSIVSQVVESLQEVFYGYKPKIDITLAEDDGGGTGIRGRQMDFGQLLREQLTQHKIVGAGCTAIGGAVASYLWFGKLEAAPAGALLGLVLLAIFVVTSTGIEAAKNPSVHWEFDTYIDL